MILVDHKCWDRAAQDNLRHGFFIGRQFPHFLSQFFVLAFTLLFGEFFFGFIPKRLNGTDSRTIRRLDGSRSEKNPFGVPSQLGEKLLRLIGAFN
ncbi:MAG: hypothetical protein NWS07_01125 [Desulfobacterales bacterium]|nr:hypothetical protein [Desulfobacterales bacterium]